MKKIISFLLSIMVLSVIGCNSTEDVAKGTNAGYEEAVETEGISETDSTEVHKEQTSVAVKEDETNVDEPKVTEESVTDKEETSKSTEEPKEDTPEPEPTTEPEPEPVGYSPDSVVAMAIAKCQAGGMITTQDNLANALAEGRITQEEYDEYYPYDGLENSYYSVFVETDLNTAGTTSGQPLRSEDEIATYIADMLLLESSPVFNIVYAGVYSSNGTDFYEFRCLR